MARTVGKVWVVKTGGGNREVFDNKADAQAFVDALNAKRAAKRERGTKARKEYKCHDCKKKIKKGDHYWKTSERLGSSAPDSFDGRNIVMHGITLQHEHCRKCATKRGLNQ